MSEAAPDETPGPQSPLRRNIELKARLRDPLAARRIAEQLSGGPGRLESQTDTYFHCHRGRLKLREIVGHSAQLVWYERDDRLEAKPSDYRLTDLSGTAAADSLRASLSAALGVRGVVKKQRLIFLVENVRIHLDTVEGLGEFLEFEAVVTPEADEARCRALLAMLSTQFKLTDSDWLSHSYGDSAKPASS